MSAFPETPATLLVKLAAQVTGEDEANWVRFADLYVPAIREFARRRGDGRDVDDVVQEVLAGLVRIFRGNKFSVREGKGNFRAYLAKMIRSQLYMAYRREKTRGLGLNVSLDDVEPSVPADSVTAAMDAEWARSGRWRGTALPRSMFLRRRSSPTSTSASTGRMSSRNVLSTRLHESSASRATR